MFWYAVVVLWPDGERRTYHYYTSGITRAMGKFRSEFPQTGTEFLSVTRTED